MTQDELNAALAASPSPDRITPEYLQSRIAFTHFERLAGGTLTVCVLTLDNGFQVTGESACADPANYNREIGEDIAYKVAERKIWPLLGFMLREAMTARDRANATKRGAPWEAPDACAIEDAAAMAHEANRAYCESIGDHSQVAWEKAPENIRESARDGVRFLISRPDAGPGAQHRQWLAFKEADGWTYGETKDPEAKTHPCMVPFAELPQEQRAKDYLFQGVVRAMLGLHAGPTAAE